MRQYNYFVTTLMTTDESQRRFIYYYLEAIQKKPAKSAQIFDISLCNPNIFLLK